MSSRALDVLQRIEQTYPGAFKRSSKPRAEWAGPLDKRCTGLMASVDLPRRTELIGWTPAPKTEALKRRIRRMKLQTPKWADRKAIARVYAETRELSRTTGRKYVVDHYYPIAGKTVSGLHVHFNLRPMLLRDNAVKSARMPTEDDEMGIPASALPECVDLQVTAA